MPIIDRVLEAASGFGGAFGDLYETVKNSIKQAKEDGKRASPQAAANSIILPILFPFTLVGEAVRRLSMWVPEHRLCPQEVLVERVRHTTTLLTTFPKTVAISVLKTWFNGIPTKFRLHKCPRRCVWCRREGTEDRQLHLVECSFFWQLLSEFLRIDVNVARSGFFLKALALNDNETNTAAGIVHLHILVDCYQNSNERDPSRLGELIRLRSQVLNYNTPNMIYISCS